jgi:hypothetical protein
MTIEELQQKRDEVFARVNESRVSHGDKSVEYSEASKALSVLDAEIARLEAQSASSSSFRTSFATFSK